MTADPQPSAPPQAVAEPDLTGSTLDRYHLLRRLGVGGMGAVYEAEHVQLHKHFALKMLREELSQNELFRHRFLREARAASLVSHPHVVSISDFGETPSGRVYFVMELLEGRDLQQLLEAEGPLPWPRAQEILLQVTSALEVAHRQGVIHRDIKPSNVFLVEVPGQDEEIFVKVLDFGIAKLSGAQAQSTIKLTSTQEIFGTVAYMAPEMAMGTSNDHRSDIYSLGVMMYQLLVGELPFTDGNAFQILSQHVSASPPRPRDKQPSIPEGVEAIVLKAMAKDPNERFASMQEFGRALRHGSLEVAEEVPTGLRTTMLHMAPLGRPPSGSSPAVAKTTPLPSSGPHAARTSGSVAAGTRAASGPVAAAVPVEPTMVSPSIAAASSGSHAVPPRAEPTVASQPIAVASDSGAGAVLERVEAGQSSPGLAAVSTSGASAPVGPAEPSRPISLVPEPAARRRSLPWIVAALVGVAGAIAAVAVYLGRDSGDVPSTVAAASTPSGPLPPADAGLPRGPQPSAAPQPHAAPPDVVVPAPAVPSTAATDPVEPAPTAADGLDAAPPEPEPHPEPHAKAKGKAKPKSDAEVVAALRAKILAKCKTTGETTVRIEGLISASGRIASPLITPATAPATCAKAIVMAAKFDPASGIRPMPRFSLAL